MLRSLPAPQAADPVSRPPGSVKSARSAGLVYVTDRMPGIKRQSSASRFRYVTSSGRLLRATADLDRIRRLAIPPAWRDVWICPKADGHLQATGRDARGRKQYRYHPDWRRVRDDTKFEQMLAFGEALPLLRQRIARDLASPELSKRTVVAAVVQLLEKTLIRVGNDEYSRSNQSFGLTTIRNGHVRISRSTIRFRFKGKGGKAHDVAYDDRRLANIVRRCQKLPGHELFGYVDDRGDVHDIGSGDVNEYLREATGEGFTAKSFRTWAGTVLAASALQRMPSGQSDAQARRSIVMAVEAVAGLLRNTPSVCRKSYIHPAILDAYLNGTLPGTSGSRTTAAAHDFHRMETVVLTLLQQRVPGAARRRTA
jgi:DNA topoisomerase-1